MAIIKQKPEGSRKVISTRCSHIVGSIPQQGLVPREEWNKALMEFAAKVHDFNERGKRMEVPHPGFIDEFRYCPECGQPLDREALGLLTYPQALNESALNTQLSGDA